MIEHRDFAVKLPKFDVVSVEKRFGALDGFGVVGTFDSFRPVEMAVPTNEVNPIFDHATWSASESAFRL
jgi:hypothetical protein